MITLPSWLLPATLHGSIAILFVCASAPLARRWLGARAAYLLWSLVLIHLLVPWLPASPLSWRGVAEPRVVAKASAVQVFVTTTSSDQPRPLSPIAMQARPTPSPLLLIWGAGVIFILCFACVRSLRAGRLIRRARDLTDDPQLQQALHSLHLGKSRLRIRETPELKSPALCGLWRPTILLPAGWETRLSPAELACVLLHEIGHLRRHDLFWRWAFLIARTFHWFNPLVWIADRAARVHQEMACDEWVLQHQHAPTPTAYGETLLAAARRFSAPRYSFPIQAEMAETKAGLRRRLHHLGEIRARSWRASAICLFVAGSCLLLSGPARSDATPTPAETVASKPAPLSTTTSATPTATAPPKDPAKFGVEIAAKIIEITTANADQNLGLEITDGRSIYTGEEFQELLRKLNQMKGIDLFPAPKVTTKSGQRATIEVIREFRYPTEFMLSKAIISKIATPTAFETRNVGVTLDIEPTMKANDQLELNSNLQNTEFEGFINYAGEQAARADLQKDALSDVMQQTGKPIDPAPTTGSVINQPIFSTRNVTTFITIPSGSTAVFGGLAHTDRQKITDTDATGHATESERTVYRSLYYFVTATIVPNPTPPPRPSITPASQPAAKSVATAFLPQPGELPHGERVPGKPGFVTSPYAPEKGYVDLRGFPENTEVKDPYTGKMFLTPSAENWPDSGSTKPGR